MDLVVYYDDRYATWWIPRAISTKITAFLVQRKFQVKNANDLASWMRKSIETNTTHQSLVVFSQDVVPDTICHSPSPSCLARAFLDSGGRMVWIGDNPFYYQGLPPGSTMFVDVLLSKEGKPVRQWNLSGPYGVLGVIPIFMHSPSAKLKFTKEGESFGLKSSWYGHRPILDKGRNPRKKLLVFGSSKPIYPISIKKILLQKDEEG
jgi:hypothetical protein